jgi:galactokinase
MAEISPALRDALGDGAGWRAVGAPGRVNLIGDHTDYNDGFCLPMAIDRRCVVAWRPVGEPRIRARSLTLDGRVDLPADGADPPPDLQPRWGRFVAGAAAALAARGAGPAGTELVVASDVPPGAGLSSSSALSVALTLALADRFGWPTADRREVARAALDAEVRATGVPGGLMDQLCALFGEPGHALLLDCRTLGVRAVPLPAEAAVVVIHSGVERTLAGTAYTERRRACEATAARLGLPALRDATLAQVSGDPIARHVVTENARVLAAVEALTAGDLPTVGRLLVESHASLRDDYRVSRPELDRLVELALHEGAWGARLTGAGFGGCIVALVPPERADRLAEAVTARYHADTGLDAQAFRVRPAGGAGPVPLP